jgi:hypothetical protein
MIFLCFGILRLTLRCFMTGQKRAESSSFAIGRLGAKKAPTVTKMTQELMAVTFRALILFVANLAEMTGLEHLIDILR